MATQAATVAAWKTSVEAQATAAEAALASQSSRSADIDQTAGKARGRDDEKEGVGGSKAFGDAAVPMAAKVLVRKALSAIGLREAVLKAAVAKTKKERK